MLSILLRRRREPSKVPFYIVGGVLAVWAVVLAAHRPAPAPSSPTTSAGSAASSAISSLLMVVLRIGAAILTDPVDAPASEASRRGHRGY